MKFDLNDMIHLKRHLNLNYINSNANKDVISSYYEDDIDKFVDEIDINLSGLSDYELIEILDVVDILINNNINISEDVIVEIDNEISNRFKDNNKLLHFLDLNHENHHEILYHDDLSEDDKLINRFINYEFDIIDILYKDDDLSVIENYDEFVENIYIFDDDSIIDEIDLLFDISDNLSYYIDYDKIIEDLIIDDYYYEFDYYYFYVDF